MASELPPRAQVAIDVLLQSNCAAAAEVIAACVHWCLNISTCHLCGYDERHEPYMDRPHDIECPVGKLLA